MSDTASMEIRAYLLEQQVRARDHIWDLSCVDEDKRDLDEIEKTKRELYLLNDIIQVAERAILMKGTGNIRPAHCPIFGRGKLLCKDVIQHFRNA